MPRSEVKSTNDPYVVHLLLTRNQHIKSEAAVEIWPRQIFEVQGHCAKVKGKIH